MISSACWYAAGVISAVVSPKVYAFGKKAVEKVRLWYAMNKRT